MPRITVFAEIACPFTHASLRRMVAVRAERGAAAVPIRVRAWPLEIVNGQPLDPSAVAQEIDGIRAGVAPDLFAGFDRATFPRTSLPAFGLAAAAYTVSDEVGERVSLALRHALFEEGRDVADEVVIRDLAARFGVTPLSPEAAIDAVQSDLERGRAHGVVGSPHFFVDEQDWFCPALAIAHQGGLFEVHVDEHAANEFYDAAFGRPSVAR
jgi:predicted DsbA family dithiol-disulfide isomerase